MDFLLGLLIGVYAITFVIVVTNLLYLRRGRKQVPPRPWPFVSILIPARNEEANLRRLIPSLLTQTYGRFEVIVYDDQSEDKSLEVLHELGDERVKIIQGTPLPAGWVGKVHALYQATRFAEGNLFLFLDADVTLADASALNRLIARYAALPKPCVMTGLTRLIGGGKLLVSLVPHAILTGLPWSLVQNSRSRALGALNGQFWMVDAALYRDLEPHLNHPNEVLEDVMIGRYFLQNGIPPFLIDVQKEITVKMYDGFGEAWHGFRKNAYLIMGGNVFAFLFFFTIFVLTYVVAPFVSLWFLIPLFGFKLLTDLRTHFPLWVSLLAPASFVLSIFLQLHSAFSHWLGSVTWKGRRV